ncbi:dimethylmenaquinone methyltransferase MenG (plasmid) [Cupriavidus necator N-1]|uniref:Putative 4-hydroxy-4-methyl-2-oxoglutarate aldolase n=1 Tax=Cupriavidus necator (strain ATCC 43291 / DSM 13513 / CCUG 52238 / LMG 8453 / N-1) TaxID=1042878 RepID=F8GUG2_CUPNN|nr:RraA family protein [Cupriavidus necator]AEI82366.1 dimethylmenaquinone methyltransferase MenG [Cupriavidus necator N-1]MDX6007376.1 RraA family protein [Cupriavidus necator]
MTNSLKANAEDQELVALFAGLDTPGVSDAMDKLGLHGQALDIMPLVDYTKVVVGPAFTVKYVPASVPPGTVGDFIDDVAEGDVVVIDNDGRTDCTVWGDIMTQYAGLRRIAGTVIDGVCRDVNKAIGDNYPLFTAGRFMRTGKDRVQVESVNATVGIGTVRVASRDIVVADANGVVIVPRGRARDVAETARKIEETESRIREQLAQGKTLGEARAALGYHTLQRKA